MRIDASRLQRWLSWGMVTLDAVLINLAFLLAYHIRYNLQWFRAVDPAYNTSYRSYLPFGLLLTGLLLLAYRMNGVYSHRRGAFWLDEFYAIVNGTMTGIVILVLITFFGRPLYYSRLLFFYAAVLIPIFLGLARIAKAIILMELRKRGIGVERVVIAGAGEVGRMVMRSLMAQPELSYQVVGFLDDDPNKGTTNLGPLKGLGSLENLPRVLRDYHVDEVIIALPWQAQRRIVHLLDQCEQAGIRVRIVPDMLQVSLTQMELSQIGSIPLLGVRKPTIAGWNLVMKRLMDVTIASTGLILLAPLMLLLAIAIRLDSPGPVLFRQTRVGKDGKHFSLYKFRSMVHGAERERERLRALNEATGPVFKIRDDPRITRIGRLLRRTSLDELPQLYNVLRGEMSLVGPRPALPEEVAQYREWHKKRLAVTPGLTGLWQVSGRSDLTFDEMMLLDIYYAENWSPALDIRIILRT
ncbi:MAG TPA: undecaprenyl-phosphate glucose phosphotransferase, partial [Anaerolineae bacterium]|nr:undecaprenyl-phosphate glucose phosphotransferase [Anaerolineae bacterium]